MSKTGLYERSLPNAAGPYLHFRYRVIRVWELPVETVLSAGISILPLAPISAARQNELPTVIERIKQRLDAEPDTAAVAELWTATKVLLGLRYEARFVDQLLKGVRTMKESTTYQAIKQEGREEGREEGRLEEVREDIRCLGEQKYQSSPPTHVQTTLEGILDLEQLKQLLKRVLIAESWDELIAPTDGHGRPPRKKRK